MPRRFNKQNKLNIKKGDEVALVKPITSAKNLNKDRERGYVGRVLQVFPNKELVIVEGVNIRLTHQKPSQENQQGGRIEQEAPIHVSNVALLDPVEKVPTRIGRRQIEENGQTRWVRYAKKSGELLDK